MLSKTDDKKQKRFRKKLRALTFIKCISTIFRIRIFCLSRLAWQYNKERPCLKNIFQAKLFQEVDYKDCIKSLKSIERKSNWQNRWIIMHENDWRKQWLKPGKNYNIMLKWFRDIKIMSSMRLQGPILTSFLNVF